MPKEKTIIAAHIICFLTNYLILNVILIQILKYYMICSV